LTVVCVLGAVQGLLLALLIYFHKKSNKSVNLFLAAYIGCICIASSSAILLTIIPWQRTYTCETYPLLIGPFLYLYIRSFREKVTWRKALPHLLPFLIFLLISYPYLNYLGSGYPDSYQVPAEVVRKPIAYFHTIVKSGIFVLYYFLSKKQLTLYQRSIQHIFSETSRINLNWARYLINGYILLIVATIVIYTFIFKYPEYFQILVLINVALVTPYVYMASYKGIMQSSIWQSKLHIKKEVIEEEMLGVPQLESQIVESERVRQPRSTMTEEKIVQIAQQIIAVMERDKLYQESELTLQDLASKLQFPSQQVSQAINEGLKRNFYDVINSYRVEEAKRLLIDPKNKNFTILSVAFEAGFNSKTTFNTVFKKFTGLTPSEFKQKQEMRVA